ncbi:protein FAM184A-like [Gigantopelta aegis]|uniref:protein FAM184A-like n=1 Tax=Gigantopelta aegis TaxID=1735272 RepID=UPI001B88A8EA|nr:protein FAM184A-like [Gigantopelta aegis]
MATGAKMSFNYYQNGKYGTLPQNPQKDMEVTHDMHLKMSKKIAQLTKVIYALNTKNDEHEAVLQSVKEQHETEMHQLLAETKEKVELYRSKISADSQTMTKIRSLEECIDEHERHRARAQEDIENFKRLAEERECNLKVEHSQRILELSQQVLDMKQEFEGKLEQFEEWKQKVEIQKARETDELRQKFDIERDELRHFHRTQNSDWLNECSLIEEKFKEDIENYKNQIVVLQSEKVQIEEECEQKLLKAQAFYEKELAAIKSDQNASMEAEIQCLKEQQENMRKDFSAMERELKLQIDRLVEQLTESEDTVEKYKLEITKLTNCLNDKDSSSSYLNEQVEVLNKEVSRLISRLKDVETDLTNSQGRCSTQADDLREKSSKLGELEAVTMHQTDLIKQLQDQLSMLNDKLKWLESERNNLMRQRDSLTEEQTSQMKNLEQSLEDLSIEKQTLQQRLEREIKGVQDRSAEREKLLLAEHAALLNKLNREHKEEIEKIKTASADVLAQTKEDLEKKLRDETARLTLEKESMSNEFERVRAELFSKLQAAENEVKRLEQLVQQSEQGLGSASSHLQSLKDASTRLKSELDSTRADLKTSKIAAANLRAELEKLQLLHDSKLAEHELEMKTRLENLAAQLDNKWTETMRTECKKLQVELTQQKDDEKKAALDKLSSLKDEEIIAIRRGLEKTVSELQKQIENLLRSIMQNENKSESLKEKLTVEADAERRRLQQEMVDAAANYASKVEQLEAAHREEIRKLQDSYDTNMEDWESKLKAKHIEDLQAQMLAHKATIEGIQQQAEQVKHAQLAELAEKHKLALDLLRSNLMEQHVEELERLKKSHQAELQTARMELQRAVEISKQRDKDHQMRAEELQGEITHRERHIRNLEDDLKSLKADLAKLNREIDIKGKEILRIRSEATNQLKLREEHWSKETRLALENLSADHMRDTQDMVNQFNAAQSVLKDKISELQIQLDEAEERYDNRDSRPEDLELIEQLRDAIQEREMRIKEIIDEKRFYQLELVNRETNFNKVFNSSPNVGVLNPLTFNNKKKRGDKTPKKHFSAPSLNTGGFPQRLDPLPGSPLHDERFNPTKPLPQPVFSKKFIK